MVNSDGNILHVLQSKSVNVADLLHKSSGMYVG